EQMIWHYAKGKPKDRVEFGADKSLADLIREAVQLPDPQNPLTRRLHRAGCCSRLAVMATCRSIAMVEPFWRIGGSMSRRSVRFRPVLSSITCATCARASTRGIRIR